MSAIPTKITIVAYLYSAIALQSGDITGVKEPFLYHIAHYQMFKNLVKTTKNRVSDDPVYPKTPNYWGFLLKHIKN